MNFNRMRTVRLLAVSSSMHCSWGGGGLLRGVCLFLGGMLLLVPAPGASIPGGWVVCSWGVPAPGGGGGIAACTETEPPREHNDRHV